jgi:hypothetical protein
LNWHFYKKPKSNFKYLIIWLDKILEIFDNFCNFKKEKVLNYLLFVYMILNLSISLFFYGILCHLCTIELTLKLLPQNMKERITASKIGIVATKRHGIISIPKAKIITYHFQFHRGLGLGPKGSHVSPFFYLSVVQSIPNCYRIWPSSSLDEQNTKVKLIFLPHMDASYIYVSLSIGNTWNRHISGSPFSYTHIQYNTLS